MNQEPIQIKDKRRQPFCIVETQFLMNENLSTCEKMVYIALCSFASARDRECYPSIDSIAQRASCSGRQVRRCLGTLEEGGYIEREFKDGRSTTYSILDLPESSSTPDIQSPRTDSPGTPDTQSGGGRTHSPGYI